MSFAPSSRITALVSSVIDRVQSSKAHCSRITTHAGIGNRRRLTSGSQCTFKFGRKGIDGKDTVPGSERIPEHDDPDRPVFGTNVMVCCPRQHDASRGGNDCGAESERGHANR